MNAKPTDRLYGVATAMTTMFAADGGIDLESTRTLTDFLIEKGVHCLYPLGTTGEMYRMSVEERKTVAKTVVEQAAGRVPVFIHVGAMTVAESVELAQDAVRTGANGVAAVTPVFFPATEDEVFGYYHAIAEAVPNNYPVYLYNIPQLGSHDLSPVLAARIADALPNVVGVKYSYPDLLRTNEYLEIRDRNFSVMHGIDSLLVSLLALGCDGTVSGISNVYPEPFVQTYEAVQKGDRETARYHSRYGFKYADLLKRGGNIAYLKEGLVYRGAVKTYTSRGPQKELSIEERGVLTKALEALDREYFG